VRDGQQPLHQRQPAIEVSLGVGVIDLEMHRLLVNGRGVPIGEQSEVSKDPRLETHQFSGEVEPPAWVPLPEHDH
jgi:hypothetical protein